MGIAIFPALMGGSLPGNRMESTYQFQSAWDISRFVRLSNELCPTDHGLFLSQQPGWPGSKSWVDFDLQRVSVFVWPQLVLQDFIRSNMVQLLPSQTSTSTHLPHRLERLLMTVSGFTLPGSVRSSQLRLDPLTGQRQRAEDLVDDPCPTIGMPQSCASQDGFCMQRCAHLIVKVAKYIWLCMYTNLDFWIV